MKNNSVYDDSWVSKFIGTIIFVCITSIIAFYVINGLYYKNNPTVKKQINYHANSVLIKTLVEIPPGAFIHRFIDYDLERVCYINSAGGGIWCEPLNRILENKDPELIEDVLSDVRSLYTSKNVPKWEHNTKKYYPKDYKFQVETYNYRHK